MARRLTDRQAAVLRLLCAGRTPSEVADELGITAPAVRSHRHLIRRRRGAAALPEPCRRGGPDVVPAGQRPAGDGG